MIQQSYEPVRIYCCFETKTNFVTVCQQMEGRIPEKDESRHDDSYSLVPRINVSIVFPAEYSKAAVSPSTNYSVTIIIMSLLASSKPPLLL